MEIPRGDYSLTGETEKVKLIFNHFDRDGCQEGKKQGTVTKRNQKHYFNRAGIKGASAKVTSELGFEG